MSEEQIIDQNHNTEVVIPANEPDLMSKISAFKKAQVPVENSEFFDYKEIEAIKDPTAKEIALKAYKSMQSGLTKKTQDLAEQRRTVEFKLKEMENWSPERIQRELNNPQFVQAAQQVAASLPQNPVNSGLTNEEFSALTDREKAELSAIKSQNANLANEINSLKQTNFQSIVAQRDEQLRQKFPDYNPIEINDAVNSLSKMNAADIREHVYKSLRFESSVKAAYEMGKSERVQLNQDKISAFTSSGGLATSSNDLPAKLPNEGGAAYFVRLAQARLAEARRK